MKRDMDLIRDILFYIEKEHDGDEPLLLDFDKFPEEKPEDVFGHVEILIQGGFLKFHKQSFIQLPLSNGITWEGHDFLDSVRDPEVWRKTKDAAEKAGGFTISLLGEIAKGLVKTKIEKHTGVEL